MAAVVVVVDAAVVAVVLGFVAAVGPCPQTGLAQSSLVR